MRPTRLTQAKLRRAVGGARNGGPWGENPNTRNGTPGDDEMIGDGGTNLMNGRDGQDTLFGLGGTDLLDGGRGEDVLRGGDGDDTLGGREGDDTLFGDRGDDAVDGGAGDDTIVWTLGDGNDRMTGGFGRDTLRLDDTGLTAEAVLGMLVLEPGSAPPRIEDGLLMVEGVKATLTIGGETIRFSGFEVIRFGGQAATGSGLG